MYFCVNYGVCDTLTIGALRSHQSLSPLTLTGFIDRSDQPFSPTKGYVARLDFEHASAYTLSDYRYNRLFFDAAVYGHSSGTKQRLLGAPPRRVRARACRSGPESGVLHPRKRFYAGGANSVRGYAENQLGPRILTIDDSTLLRGATSVGGGIVRADASTAVKFCDPNSPQAVATAIFSRSRSAARRCSRGASSIASRCRSARRFRNFVGAVFIDGGVVGSGDIKGLQSLSSIIKGTGAITPGVGIRYESGRRSDSRRLRVQSQPRPKTLGVVTAVRDKNGRDSSSCRSRIPRQLLAAARFCSIGSRSTSRSARRTSGAIRDGIRSDDARSDGGWPTPRAEPVASFPEAAKHALGRGARRRASTFFALVAARRARACSCSPAPIGDASAFAATRRTAINGAIHGHATHRTTVGQSAHRHDGARLLDHRQRGQAVRRRRNRSAATTRSSRCCASASGFRTPRSVRPLVVLDRPPNGKWNWQRIFPRDTTPKPPSQQTEWGDWLRFTNATVVDGQLIVRSPWHPRSTLRAAARDSAIREALAGQGAARSSSACAGGFQKIVQLDSVNAQRSRCCVSREPGMTNQLARGLVADR